MNTATSVGRSPQGAAVVEPESTPQRDNNHAGRGIMKRAVDRLKFEHSSEAAAFSDHADYAAHHEFTQSV